MYRLKYTKEFERDLKRLSAAEQKQTANKLKKILFICRFVQKRYRDLTMCLK